MKKIHSKLWLCIFFGCWPIFGFAQALQLNYVVHGLSGEILANVQKRLNATQALIADHATPQYIEAILLTTKKDVTEAIAPFGYFSPIIDASFSNRANIYTATYQIQLGPVTLIHNIKIQLTGPGKNEEKFLEYLHHYPMLINNVFVSKTYEQAKQHWFDISEKLGYLDAHFTTQEVFIDPQKHTADIRLVFATGARFRYGKIGIDPGPYSLGFIERFIPFEQGEYFSPQGIYDLQRNLSNTDYFQNVQVTDLRNQSKNDNVPIDIKLTPRPRYQYLAGIGYGTDTGVRATLGVHVLRLNKAGHQLQAIVKGSQLQNDYLFRYLIPGKNPLTDQYSLQLSRQNLDVHAGTASIDSLTGLYSHVPREHWQISYSLSYQQGQSEAAADDFTIHSHFLIPTFTASYIHSKGRIFTERGFKINFDVRGASQALASDSSFIQSSIQTKVIQNVFDWGRFIFRGQAGFLSVHDVNNFPFYLQFMMGGPESLRGFRYYSVGPGRYMKLVSFEYQQKIYKEWYATIFLDMGNASDQLNAPWLRSVGIGGGYISPLGPIQVSVASALDDRTGGAFLVQMSLGPDF